MERQLREKERIRQEKRDKDETADLEKQVKVRQRQEKEGSRQSSESDSEGERARPREEEPNTDLCDEEVQAVKPKTKQAVSETHTTRGRGTMRGYLTRSSRVTETHRLWGRHGDYVQVLDSLQSQRLCQNFRQSVGTSQKTTCRF